MQADSTSQVSFLLLLEQFFMSRKGLKIFTIVPTGTERNHFVIFIQAFSPTYMPSG